LGFAAELFCAFGTVTSDEGLKISSAFVSSIFGVGDLFSNAMNQEQGNIKC
jgi:hypothetical protein